MIIVIVKKGGGQMISRKSQKRDRILTLLQSVTCHPTAEWIYMMLKDEIPELSLATVYRNLEQLTEMGIIQKIEGDDKTSHFDGNAAKHFHLGCTSCKKIFDIPHEFIAIPVEGIIKEAPFEVTDYTVSFRGICPDCKIKAIN